MFISDIDILLEILYRSDLGDISEKILNRKDTIFENGKFQSLDLSDLGLMEVPEVIYLMDKLQRLDLKNNKIKDLPYEILFLEDCEVLLDGNPIGSLEKIRDRLQSAFDEMGGVPRVEYNGDVTEDSMDVYYKDRECSWCYQNAGYRKEESRVDTKWGRSTHVFTSLICLNCSHVEFFYGDGFRLRK